MTNILASPVDFNVSNQRYGKSYNLLQNLDGDDIFINGYVNELRDELTVDNVRIHEFGYDSRFNYFSMAFYQAARELSTDWVDIYHHMNLSYRWFNPVLLAGLHGETPVVIGPCQTGHEVMAHEFNRITSNVVGFDLPRWLTDSGFSATEMVRDIILDPPRMALYRRTLEQADRIVAVHDDAKSALAQIVDETKIETIPLGVDPELFEFTERSRTQEIVAIGNLHRRKGYDILLEALDTVAAEFPDVHLRVFGEGPLEPELRQQVSELGLTSNVTFHGYVDQSVIRNYLSQARAFVHPSRSESFSLVRLEAMSVGCPVVISDTSGATEMVRDGEEGYVVSRGSSSEIADAVMEILGDYNLAKDMGRSARRRVEEKYNWRTIGRQYVDIYRELA